MQRSNSSSHIPLPRTSGIRRSRSLTRMSSRETTYKRDPSITRNSTKVTPLNKNRQESHLTRYSNKVTPLNKIGVRLPSSALSSKNKASPGSAFRESKTIQQLASSKKWVGQQFAKVQDFIDNSGHFDPLVVTSKNIKPPSIKAFVYVSKVLLEQFYGLLDIDMTNYKEVIADKLKVMQYPGTVTKSLFKTVNTMHSWPQVIGMWAWLIDQLVSATQKEEKSLSCMDPAEKEMYLKMESFREFLVERYNIFNRGNDPEKVEQANEAYLREFSEICGFDPEEYSNIEDQIRDLRNRTKKHEDEIMELNNRNRERLHRIEAMKKEIEEFESSNDAAHQDLEEQLQQLKAEKNKILAKREALKAERDNLRAAIHEQACTHGKKKELLTEVNELKRAIETKKSRVIFLKTICHDYSQKIDEEIFNIYNTVNDWNRQIIPLSINEPRLKELQFREDDFQNEEFLNEIKEVMHKKIDIDGAIAHEANLLDRDISRLQDDITDEESEVLALEKKLTQVQDKIKDLAERIIALKSEKKCQLDEWEREKDLLLCEHKTLEQMKACDLKQLENELQNLQRKIGVDKQELEKLMQKSLAAFVEIYKRVRDNHVFINSILSAALDRLKKRRLMTLVENQSNFLNALEKLQDLKVELEKSN